MRILSIRGQNLASLAGEFAVDFTAEPLAGSGIFAITGPTGAGKSTLLDAVCLALFNEIPRLKAAPASGRIGENEESGLSIKDTRAILRHGTGEGYAEVDFAMPDGAAYRARWSVKRARGKADGKIQNYDHSFERLDTAERLGGTRSETKEAIRQIIGLSAEQFGRAVLLAQGDFEAFIRADANDRALLLERLTGSEIYTTLGQRAFDKASVFRADIDGLRDQIARQHGLDDAQRAAAEEALLGARSAETEAIARHDTLKATRQWEERCVQLADFVERARADVTVAEDNHAAAGDRRTALAQDRRALALTPNWTELAKAQQRAADAKWQVELAEQAHLDARAAEDQSLAAEHAAIADCTTAENNATVLGPAIAAARELDARMAEAARNVASLRAETEAAQVRLDAAHENHQVAQIALADAIAAQTADRAWLEANGALSVLAMREAELAASLSEHAGILAQLDQLKTDLPVCVQAQQTALAGWDSAVTALEGATSLHQAAAQSLRKAEAAVPAQGALQALTQRRDALGKVDGLLRSYEASTSALQKAEEAVRATNDRIEAGAIQQRELTTRQDEVSARLPTLAVAVADARRELDLLRAAASDAAETLRARLAPDAPCPVCGSAEHQLSIFEGKLGQHLREREDAAKALEATQSDLAQKAMQLSAQLAALGNTTANLAREQVENIAQRDLAAISRDAAQADLLAQVRSVDLPGDIDALPAALSAERERADKGLAELMAARDRADAARKSEQLARVDLDRAQQSHAAAREALGTHTRVLDELGKAIADTEAGLGRTAEMLDRYLTPAADWRELPDATQWLKANAASWRERSAQEEERVAGLPSLQAAEASTAAALAAQLERTGELVAKLAVAEQDHSDIAHQREGLLDGETVAAVEQRIADTRERSIAARQQATGLREACSLACAAATAQLAADRTTADGAQADYQLRADSFSQALLDADLIAEDVARVAKAGSTALETEAQALAQLENAIGNARAVLLQREQDLAGHNASEPPALLGGELRVALTEAERVCREAGERRGDAELVLRQDDAVRAQTAQLRADLEKRSTEADVWLRLSDLIGDRTGATFRRFAQGLTLDRLLEHANTRLCELKPRYTLERAGGGDMLIQVLDNDMGGQIRGLHNLSGGERFLVSLSLALGLAEMSTASGVRIESLFIDEGFGALDAASLGQAVALLEHLHATGRRVGVISHVEELKERIPVKIEVIPTGRGTSRIEVVEG